MWSDFSYFAHSIQIQSIKIQWINDHVDSRLLYTPKASDDGLLERVIPWRMNSPMVIPI